MSPAYERILEWFFTVIMIDFFFLFSFFVYYLKASSRVKRVLGDDAALSHCYSFVFNDFEAHWNLLWVWLDY